MGSKTLIRFLIVVVFVIDVSPLGLLAGGTSHSETGDQGSSIIEAMDLLTRKDRLAAIQVLNRALLTTNKKTARQEIRSALSKAEEVFFTEQGQQAYEFANTLQFDQVNQAKEKFKEALQIEGANTLIIGSLVRLLVSTGDCLGAQAILKPYLLDQPNASKLAMSEAYIFACKGNFSELQNFLQSPRAALLEPGMARAYGLEADINSGKLIDEQAYRGLQSQHLPILWRALIRYDNSPTGDIRTYDHYLDFCRRYKKEILDNWKYDPRLCSDEAEVQKKKAQLEQTTLQRKSGE